MGESTKIQWTHHTFNPWTRCTKISPACDHCYAETWAGRATHPKDGAGRALPLWGPDAPRTPTSRHNWRQPYRWNREAAEAGERRRVFCASLADVFEAHPEIEAHRARPMLWSLIEECTALDWLLLTKRPENIRDMVPAAWCSSWPAHVLVGTTVEDQQRAEERIPHLLRVPARVRFLSMEPLLEPVDLTDLVKRLPDGSEEHIDALHCDVSAEDDEAYGGATISWVIIGGESGHHARPFDLAWARSLVAQCQAAGVAPFVKQLGAKPVEHGSALRLRDSHGGDPAEWPADLRVREVPR